MRSPLEADAAEVLDAEAPRGGITAETQPQPHRPYPQALGWLKRAAWTVAAAQAVLLMVASAHAYSHFDLTLDFAVAAQGWSQIAHGHLTPYMTINPHNYPHYGYPFITDHFELIMWPLALMYFVYPHSIDLLLVQDLAIAGCTLVTALFAVDILLLRSSPRRGLHSHLHGASVGFIVLGAGLLVLLVVNPFVYWTAFFDFHIQPVATLFILLTARALWAGRRRRALAFAALVLLCGNVAATYLVALGLAAVLARRSVRVTGLGLIVGGALWSAVIGASGMATGTLMSNYAYLTHVSTPTKVTALQVIKGAIEHPATPLHMLWARAALIYRWLASAGIVGLVMPLGLGFGLVLILTNELNGSPVFSTPVSSFQGFPLYFFVALGSLEALALLLRSPRRALRWLAVILAVGLFVQAGVVAAIWAPRARTAYWHVDDAAATQLARAVLPNVPATAEVIASQGIIGRFATRQLVFPFLDGGGAGQEVPVYGRSVVFVLTTQGIEFASAQATLHSVAFIEQHRVRTLSDRHDVYSFVWHPPRGTTFFTFPPTAS